MFVGIAVDYVINDMPDIRHVASIEQRIAFCRRPVRHHAFSSLFGRQQKRPHIAPRGLDLLGKCLVHRQLVQSRLGFARFEGVDPRLYRPRHVRRVAGKDTQRPAMSRQFFHIKYRQPVGRKYPFHREQRKIEKVFVINRVELVFRHQTHDVRKFHGDDALGIEETG